MVEYIKQRLNNAWSVLVLDIDGTLAEDTARCHLRTANRHCARGADPEQLLKYMDPEMVALDTPVAGAWEFIEAIGDVRILLCTARCESLREVTEAWLRTHYPRLQYEGLKMRALGDFDPSIVVKYNNALDHCNGGVWIDDDPAMLQTAAEYFFPLRAPVCFAPRNRHIGSTLNSLFEEMGIDIEDLHRRLGICPGT